MATVKSVTVFSERPWTDGNVRRRYEVTLTDNNLVDEVIIAMPVNVLSSDDGTALADKLLVSKQLSEAGLLRNKTDILANVLSPQWSPTKALAKYAIRYMMREKDPLIVVQYETFIDYLRANYNATQIENLLDITSEQVSRMNRRINAILSDTGTAKDLLVSFNTEQEDIE